MPIFEYKCSHCGEVWEVLEGYTANGIKKCLSCSEEAHRVPSATGYRRDYTVIENTPDEEKFMVYPESGY